VGFETLPSCLLASGGPAVLAAVAAGYLVFPDADVGRAQNREGSVIGRSEAGGDLP